MKNIKLIKRKGKLFRKTTYYSKKEKRQKVYYRQYIKVKCAYCGCTTYQAVREYDHNKTPHCSRSCRWSGKFNPSYNPDCVRDTRGYIMLRKPNHPMADKHGYIKEHRFVMAEYLNRNLKQSEVVHHINGIKQDNRIENLILLDNESDHIKAHWSYVRHVEHEKKILWEVIESILPLSIKYCHGRHTYAPSIIRSAVATLKSINPDFKLKHDITIEPPEPEEIGGMRFRSDWLDDLFEKED